MLILFMLITNCVIVSADNVNVYVDNELVNLTDVNGNAVYPILQDGTTYVPIRAISQLLGYEIDWDGDNRNVFIYKNISKGSMMYFYNVTGEVQLYVDNVIQYFTDVNGKTVYTKRNNVRSFERGVSGSWLCG